MLFEACCHLRVIEGQTRQSCSLCQSLSKLSFLLFQPGICWFEFDFRFAIDKIVYFEITVPCRYKDSIAKSTRGFKEKLLAHNSSVKDLSREVHREMSAGIAGVAKMIERLDLASKRTRVSAPSSSYDGGTSDSLHKGKSILSNHETTRETAHDANSHIPFSRQEASILQVCKFNFIIVARGYYTRIS